MLADKAQSMFDRARARGLRGVRWFALAACSIFVAHPAHAQVPKDLTEASLEDLMNIQVTSVAKKEQSLSKSGAAVFVITQDDIRHSGLNSIPELLRMVPGVDVARIDRNTWAISIRGFNYHYSNKVLVLIDGRTVYSSIYSGVFWDHQDVPVEDIERIEVIRGPGGTVWGANAVNGVINIITKSSKDTQGGLVTAGGGTERNAQGLSQYGGQAGRNGTYRVFGNYFQDGSAELPTGGTAGDSWHGSHGGFRSDWDLTERDKLTVQGDLFGASEGQTITTVIVSQLPDMHTLQDKIRVGAGNVLGRWTHTFSNGSEASLQLYYDHVRRIDQISESVVDTGDADFQYHFQAGTRNDIVVGGGYRLADQNFRAGYELAYNPNHTRDSLTNVFFQDEVRLANSLALTIGSKFERNDYTGFEYEPSTQLVWTPIARETLWFSAARAIRQPAWSDRNAEYDLGTVPLPGGGFGLFRGFGNPNVKAEQVLDFEGGYRANLSKRVSLDLVMFRSRYRSLTSFEPESPYFAAVPSPPHLVLPYRVDSLAHANNWGGEFFATWNAARRWRISPGYSYLQMKVAPDPGGNDTYAIAIPGSSPKHQFQVRSNMDLPRRMEWNTSVFYVSELRNGPVPSYTRFDTRVGWRASESVELSVGAQNLFGPRHLEFIDGTTVDPSTVGRSVFGKLTWRF